MAHEINLNNIWQFISNTDRDKSVSYVHLCCHFGIDPDTFEPQEKNKLLTNFLNKLENNGAIVVNGASNREIFLQRDLPAEIDVKFNTPKQNDKVPTIALDDRGLIQKTRKGKKFKRPQLNLNSDLDLSQLRSIDKARVFLSREADGSYTAHIKEVLIQKTLKDTSQNNRSAERQAPRARNQAKKSSLALGILNEMGIPHSFSQSALDQATNIIKDSPQPSTLIEKGTHVDLRDVPFVTIDNERTKLRDDAIYAYEDTDSSNPGGHILWIAHPDVDEYIKPGSPLDQEAEARGETLYLPGMRRPLFPDELTEHVFSLDANRERACVAYEVKVSADGEILNQKFHTGVMRSRAAFSYEQVADALNDNSDDFTAKYKDDVLLPLAALNKSLEKNNALREVINYGRASNAHKTEGEAAADSIVGNTMQISKICAGTDQRSSGKPGVYRAQKAPTKVNDKAVTELVNLGLITEDNLPKVCDLTRSYFNALFSAAGELDDPKQGLTAIKALLPKSIYTAEEIGHFTFAVDAYSPITNPARNYTDLLCLRRLKNQFNETSGDAQKDFSKSLEKQNAIQRQNETAKARVRESMPDGSQMARAFNAHNEYADLLKDQDLDTAVLRKMGIPYEFSEEAMNEIESILATKGDPEDLLQDPLREDLTHIPFVTIDGEDAKDFDDAVYCEDDTDPSNPGGSILYEAIADVSYYVRHGSALDKEAKERATSVYLTGKVVPMLPEALSNGLCSLNPNEYRGALTCRKVIDKDGNILSHSYHNSVIKSRARLTYNEVLDSFDGVLSDNIAPIYEDLIVPLKDGFQKRLIESEARGALNFDLPQMSIFYDSDDESIELNEVRENDARRLIAEYMISSNICAAKEQERGKAGVYRVHDDPTAGNIEAIDILVQLGVLTESEKNDGIDKSKDNMKRLLAKAENCNEPELAQQMLIRLLAYAKYSAENIGHFALGILPPHGYSHSTSPIRRYPDLLVHRNIKDINGWDNGQFPSEVRKELDSVLESCTEKSRRADVASLEVRKAYQMRHLEKLEGEILKARITHANAEEGIKISLSDLKFKAGIHLSMLPAGEYKYDSRTQVLSNEDSGHAFPVGHTINVMLATSATSEDGIPSFRLASPDQLLPDNVWAQKQANNPQIKKPKAP